MSGRQLILVGSMSMALVSARKRAPGVEAVLYRSRCDDRREAVRASRHCDSRRLSSRVSDRSAAEQARSRPALPYSAVGTAGGLWSGVARGWQAPDPLQVVVKNPIDDAQRMCSFLGRDLPQDEVDRVRQAQRVGSR